MSVERVVGVRKVTRFQLCERHAPWFAGASRARKIECMVEGGPGGWAPGCAGGTCRLWPGTDVFEPSVCGGELELDWTREDPDAPASVFTLHELEDGEGNGIVHWYCSVACRARETNDYGDVEPFEVPRDEVPEDSCCEGCGVNVHPDYAFERAS